MNFDAIEALVRRGRLSMEADIAADKLSADEIIRDSGLIRPWSATDANGKPSNFARNAVRTYGDQVVRCAQAHDLAQTPGVTPNDRAIWVPYHATDPRYARPFVQPTMAEDVYYKGECMVWTDGLTYRAKRDGVDRGPDILPNDWETVEVM